MAFKTFRLAIAALVLTVFITACQNDRISRSLSPETGEFYSSDALSSTRSGHSEEERKLQADFDAFCTELFQKEMESSSTLDLHYTIHFCTRKIMELMLRMLLSVHTVCRSS